MGLGSSATSLCKSSHDITVDGILCPGLQLKQSHAHNNNNNKKNKNKTAPWNEIIGGVQTQLSASLDASWTHCFIFRTVQFVSVIGQEHQLSIIMLLLIWTYERMVKKKNIC